jgi:hypothetical protein
MKTVIPDGWKRIRRGSVVRGTDRYELFMVPNDWGFVKDCCPHIIGEKWNNLDCHPIRSRQPKIKLYATIDAKALSAALQRS